MAKTQEWPKTISESRKRKADSYMDEDRTKRFSLALEWVPNLFLSIETEQPESVNLIERMIETPSRSGRSNSTHFSAFKQP